MSNEFDSIVPNTQTPRRSRIGTPDNQWDEIYACSGNFDQISLAGQVISGVISYDQAQFRAELDGLSANFIIIHNLGTKYVDVSIYDTEGDSVVPDNIKVIDSSMLQITFVEIQAGVVLIQKGKE